MDRDSSGKHTDDGLLGGRIRLLQARQGYRAAIDPVFLAAAVPLRSGQTALELGLGSGAAALCLLARVPGGKVVGIERDPALARLAERNAKRNGHADALRVLQGDIVDPALTKELPPFDHAFANPPYLETLRHDPPRAEKRSAHVEDTGLEHWVTAARRRLKPRGTLTLIHRADRLNNVLAALSTGWGGITAFPLWPRSGEPAKRVVVQAVKGSRGALTIRPGLVLHDADGYTLAAQAILAKGEALRLSP